MLPNALFSATVVSMRRLTTFLFPGSLMLIVALILMYAPLPPDWQGGIRSIYPVVVLIVGMVLGWRFHRSRLLLALLILAACDRTFVHALALPGGSLQVRALQNGVALCLPVNLALLALAPERGILSIRGIYRLILIGLQAAALALIHTYANTRTLNGVAHALADMPTAFLQVPWLVFIAFFASMVAMLYRFTIHATATESGFFWAILIALFGVWPEATPVMRSGCFATAGLTLVLSLVEASYGMAFRDELTGLPARRALQESLGQLTGIYTVAMVDVDHFKNFNDRYGHDVGDQVLRMVASKLARIGGSGKAYRYGGEEFTLLFAGKDLEDALPHLERVRRDIAELDFTIRGPRRPRKRPDKVRPRRSKPRKTHITVSVGAAERSRRQSGAEDVLRAADKALYKAKQKGRNRVCT